MHLDCSLEAEHWRILDSRQVTSCLSARLNHNKKSVATQQTRLVVSIMRLRHIYAGMAAVANVTPGLSPAAHTSIRRCLPCSDHAKACNQICTMWHVKSRDCTAGFSKVPSVHSKMGMCRACRMGVEASVSAGMYTKASLMMVEAITSCRGATPRWMQRSA